MAHKLPCSPGEILAELTNFQPSATISANIVGLDAIDVRFDDDVDTIVSSFCRHRKLRNLPSGFETSNRHVRDAIRDFLTVRASDDYRGNTTVPEQHAANIAKRFAGLFKAPVRYFAAIHQADFVFGSRAATKTLLESLLTTRH